MNAPYIGRLAPSPTGLLHVGNAFAFLIAWLDARKNKGKLILRMEDIDPDRAKDHFAQQIREDLKWLGLNWDEEVIPQSERQKDYDKAIQKLAKRGYVYPCFCSRKELRSLAGAPHIGDSGAPYAGTCRRLTENERKNLDAQGKKSCLRLDCSEKENTPFQFKDHIQGNVSSSLKECGNDFAIKRSDGVIAYQLAVVLDDIKSGITHVIRGRDILQSTPRQLYIYELLKEKPPVYAHVPLIVDEKGERLAKRHGTMALNTLRKIGVLPEEIWGVVAKAAGLRKTDTPVKAIDLIEDFEISKLNHKDFCLTDFPRNQKS